MVAYKNLQCINELCLILYFHVFCSRYGVIHGTGELELQPLDKHTDEDEEDMTLFDVKDSKRPK